MVYNCGNCKEIVEDCDNISCANELTSEIGMNGVCCFDGKHYCSEECFSERLIGREVGSGNAAISIDFINTQEVKQ